MEIKHRNPKIFLIAGKARVGKNLVADYIKEFYEKNNQKVVISPYTKYLKMYIEEITNEKIDEDNKPRDLLQQISAKIIKQELSMHNFFIDRQIEDLKIYSYFMDIIIIPDVRFKEEIIKIKEKFPNVISIGVTRKNFISPLTKEQQEDITEVSLDNYHNYDFEIENDKYEDLKNKVLKIIDEIRKEDK